MQVARWFKENADPFLERNQLGSSLSDSEGLLQEYKEFELKAKVGLCFIRSLTSRAQILRRDITKTLIWAELLFTVAEMALINIKYYEFIEVEERSVSIKWFDFDKSSLHCCETNELVPAWNILENKSIEISTKRTTHNWSSVWNRPSTKCQWLDKEGISLRSNQEIWKSWRNPQLRWERLFTLHLSTNLGFMKEWKACEIHCQMHGADVKKNN